MAASTEHMNRQAGGELPPYLADAFKEAAERAVRLSKEEYPPYPADRRVAPLSGHSKMASELASQIRSYLPDMRNSYNLIQRGASPFIGGPENNRQQYLAPYQRAVIDNIPINARATYQEGFMPELRSRFFKQGQRGRGRHQGLSTELHQSLHSEIGNQQAQAMSRGHAMASQGYDMDRVRALESANFSKKLALMNQTAQITDIQALKDAGLISQDQAQRILEHEYEQWKEQQRKPYEQLSQYFSALQGVPYVPSTFVKSEIPRQPYPSPDFKSLGVGLLGDMLFGGNRGSTVQNFAPAMIAALMARGSGGQPSVGMPPAAFQQAMAPSLVAAQERERQQKSEREHKEISEAQRIAAMMERSRWVA